MEYKYDKYAAITNAPPHFGDVVSEEEAIEALMSYIKKDYDITDHEIEVTPYRYGFFREAKRITIGFNIKTT